MDIFLNSMILHVNVPVLSEKMYSIYPSSSFRFEDCTIVGVMIVSPLSSTQVNSISLS